jgi:hypothetical protein
LTSNAIPEDDDGAEDHFAFLSNLICGLCQQPLVVTNRRLYYVSCQQSNCAERGIEYHWPNVLLERVVADEVADEAKESLK